MHYSPLLGAEKGFMGRIQAEGRWEWREGEEESPLEKLINKQTETHKPQHNMEGRYAALPRAAQHPSWLLSALSGGDTTYVILFTGGCARVWGGKRRGY